MTDQSTALTVTIANPATGEALALSEPTDRLAEELDAVKEMESRLREYKREVWREVLRRMDAEATWNVRAGGLKLTGASPNLVEYDAKKLGADLWPLVEQGVISLAAYESAIEEVVSWKAKKRGINALLKLGGVVAETVRASEVAVDPETRRVNVSRAT